MVCRVSFRLWDVGVVNDAVSYTHLDVYKRQIDDCIQKMMTVYELTKSNRYKRSAARARSQRYNKVPSLHNYKSSFFYIPIS